MFLLKYYKILLLLIVLLAGFLRFFIIDKVPVSLYWDEVGSAYNAYSIAYTGRDEYGTSFPLLFQSFNDYKAPGNIYLMSPIVRVFGLSEVTARFTSVFFGTLMVFFSFFFIKELLQRSKLEEKKIIVISLLTSLLLAISPWHIQFSRTGFEANVAISFIVLGLFLFFRGIRGKLWSFYLAMPILAYAFYLYRSIHIFLPLLLFIIVLLFRHQLFDKKFRKPLIIGAILFLLVFLPFALNIFSKNGLVRARQVNIFTNSFDTLYENAKKQVAAQNDPLAKIIYNRRIVYAELVFQGYINHFDPKFLFFQGDGNIRHGVLGMGLLYLWEIPFLLAGVVFLLRLQKQIKIFVLAWILLAPLPASFGVPSPHALRSLNMLPMPQLLSAMGIVWAFLYLKSNRRIIAGIFLSFIIVAFFYRYLLLYFGTTPNLAAKDWADGYKQLTRYVFKHEKSYDKVVVSGHYWEPYVYFLFYKQYDPSLYQKYGSSRGFDKYVFGGTSWDKEKNSIELDHVDLKKFANADNILVALSSQEYDVQKDNVDKLDEIRNKNNEIVFIVGRVK